MRLFITPAGEEAWFSALVRNVRLQLTRFEIGTLDVYSLSGAKAGGQSVQQFRNNNYTPDWEPDFGLLRSSDSIVYEGNMDTVGYWRVGPNDGGIIIRVPASVDTLDLGNIRIYGKNTGPYPFAMPKAARYRRYEEIYDNDSGGEVMLFAGFAAVADSHWKIPAAFPHFTDIRLSINADGLFNVLDVSQFAFEGVVDVFEADTEADLDTNNANAYGCAVISHHTKTGKPAVAYRTHGAKQWVGYPLNETFSALLEEPRGFADPNIDGGLLDIGTIDPPAISVDSPQGTIISSQPRKITLNPLAFNVSNVDYNLLVTDAQTITLAPNTGQPYVAVVKVADLAFLGMNQLLYFMHNGTRYRLCARGKSYSTPPIIFRHNDSVWLEGRLEGPVSSLAGVVYAELNESPISNDADNTPIWLVGRVSMHIGATVPCKPKNLDFGLTGRRIAGYSWEETTPEQRITGLGYTLYGYPQTTQVTIRVAETAGKNGGTSFTYGNQQSTTAKQSYLRETYLDPEGKAVVRRGITGLAGTALHVIHNGVDVGAISTPLDAEQSVTITVKENDRLSFKAVLVGQEYDPTTAQPQVLPAMALAVEGISSYNIPWLKAEFDIAATFGPDVTPPVTSTLPDLPLLQALESTVALSSLDEITPAGYLLKSTTTSPSVGNSKTVAGSWVALLASPNPLANALTTVTVTDVVVSDPAAVYSVELERFDPWDDIVGTDNWILADNVDGTQGPYNIYFLSGNAFRVKVQTSTAGVTISLTVNMLTDAGNKALQVEAIFT